MVFSEDWFSTPTVTTICQEDGEFEQPDWEDLSCVFRRFQKMNFLLNKYSTLQQRQQNVMSAPQLVSTHLIICKRPFILMLTCVPL